MPELGDVITYTDTASLPAAAIAGRLAYVSDETPPGIFRDSGTDWERVSADGLANPMTDDQDIIVSGPGGSPDRLGKGAQMTVLGVDTNLNVGYFARPKGATELLIDPPTSGWTTIGGQICSFSGGQARVQSALNASDHVEARVRAATVGSTRQYHGFFVPSWFAEKDVEAGLALNDSTTGQYVTLSIGWDDTAGEACARVTYWTDLNTKDSEAVRTAILPAPAGLLIIETASSRAFYLSHAMSSNNMLEVWSGGLDFMTNRADRVGFFINPKAASGGYNVGVSMPHWFAS